MVSQAVTRFLITPLVLFASAIATIKQWREERWRHCAGWLSPEMEPHWQRLFEWKWGDIQHDAKNVLAEWCALDPQRAAKAFSFIIVLLAIVAVLT